VEHREYTKEQAEAYMEGYNEMAAIQAGRLTKKRKNPVADAKTKYQAALDSIHENNVHIMEDMKKLVADGSYDNAELLKHWDDLNTGPANNKDTYMKKEFQDMKEESKQFLAEHIRFDDGGEALMNVIEGKGHGTLGNDFAVRVLNRMDVTPEVGHRILDYSNTRSDAYGVKNALIDCTGYDNVLNFHYADFISHNDDSESAASVEENALEHVHWDYDDLESSLGKFRIWNNKYYSRYADAAARREAPSYLNQNKYVNLRSDKTITDDDKKYFMDNIKDDDAKTRTIFLDRLDYVSDGPLLLKGARTSEAMRNEIFEDSVNNLQINESVYEPLINELGLEDEDTFRIFVGERRQY
jgi:hypothetical protein